MHRMNKRGQFYIFAAIVLALVIFAVTTQVNRLQEQVLTEDFNDLSKNYASEAKQVVNNQIARDPTKVDSSLATFTQNYLKYAKSIDPNMGLVYVYKNSAGQVVVANYLSSASNTPLCPVGLPNNNCIYSAGSTAINSVNLSIGSQVFKESVPTTLNNFQGYSSTQLSAQKPINLQLGGIFYNVKSTGAPSASITFISTSQSTPTTQQVSFTSS